MQKFVSNSTNDTIELGERLARTLKGGVMAFTLKTLASFGFVTSGVVGLIINQSISSQFKWALGLIVIGLLLGMIGDMVLDLKVIYDND